MITLSEYLDETGRSPFGRWFARLDAQAAAKVATAVYRLAEGNTSNTKSVGGGVSEQRIDFGPGYRVYFGRVGTTLVILLGGGSKRGQAGDIAEAQAAWLDYRRRRRAAAKE